MQGRPPTTSSNSISLTRNVTRDFRLCARVHPQSRNPRKLKRKKFMTFGNDFECSLLAQALAAIMSGVSIETPYVVASLPKPLDREHGRVLSAPVHGLQGSKKRKRHEIAVGVDGEAVNIFNVNGHGDYCSHEWLTPVTDTNSKSGDIVRLAPTSLHMLSTMFCVPQSCIR